MIYMIEILLIHLFLQFQPSSNAILNSSYQNVASYSQLFQLTNAGTGGLEELFLMLLLYFVFTISGIIAGRINPVLSALGASILMVPISLLSQAVFLASGGAIGAVMPLVFIALAIITAMVSLLSGFLSPYS